jgi:Holliday junction DNA helicase RuvA
MIAQLHGRVLEKSLDKDALRVTVDVQGVGYELFLAKSSETRFNIGETLVFRIRESVTAFDGATTLYGFLSKEECDLFTRIRENVDGMGPKKALECLDKITKSLPDFKRAVIEGDHAFLVSVFGFTKKTAEKLVVALKDKLDEISLPGTAKWADVIKGPEFEAVSGLVNLGYTEQEARQTIQRAKEKLGPNASMKALLQESLRTMGARLS